MGKPREFDRTESMRVMPRLYEHIDRVDLWVMAQKDQYERDMSAYLEMEQEANDQERHCKQLRAKNQRLINAIKVHLGRKTRGYPTPQEWELFWNELNDATKADQAKEGKNG